MITINEQQYIHIIQSLNQQLATKTLELAVANAELDSLKNPKEGEES